MSADLKRTREEIAHNKNGTGLQRSKQQSPTTLSQMKEKLDLLQQEHIYQQLSGFDVDHPVFIQLDQMDIAASVGHFRSAKEGAIKAGDFKPINQDRVFDYRQSVCGSEKQTVEDIGFQAIIDGTVAAVIMSGGQGTRLGYPGPKGMYDMGLPSKKTIFQLHIERIIRIKNLSIAHQLQQQQNQNSNGEHKELKEVHIPIYIMTSEINHSEIEEYFITNDYFGYSSGDISFFEQGLEPAFDHNGKIIIESSKSLSLSPDGNGGIYKALQRCCVTDMLNRGIQHLHIYGIDNVLTKSLDPVFIGTCVQQNVQVGNKVVWRKNASEKVGVTAELNGKMHILEYSEIPENYGSLEDDHGKLIYGAANICNHYLSLDFLVNQVFLNLSSSYHFANKKITQYDPATGASVAPKEPNGVKLEMFIFDVFPLAERWLVLECDRESEFAPVKNAPGSAQDSPDTAREMMHNEGIKWLYAAGASIIPAPNKSNNHPNPNNHTVDATNMCEISPLLSYAGEGLGAFRAEKVQLPCYLKV